MALPKPVGNGTVGAHRLPAVQEEILPQNINQDNLSFFHSVDAIILLFFIPNTIQGKVYRLL